MSGKKKTPVGDVRAKHQLRFAAILPYGRPVWLQGPTPRYTGKLAKPLPGLPYSSPPFEGSLPPFLGYEDIGKHIDNEMLSRIFLLLDYFGIPEDLPKSDQWFILALGLARNHVPGFRFGKAERRGALTRWGYGEQLALYAAVKLLVLDGLTVVDACQQLAETKKIRSMKAQSLRTRFQRIKRENPSAKVWDTCPPEEYPGFKKFLSAVLK